MHTGKFLVTFVCLLLVWFALTASLDPQEVVAGVIISLIVALPSHEFLFREEGWKKWSPSRIAYALAYIPHYLWAEIKAHANVIYRILHPKMPIKPGIVKIPTSLQTDFGITALANSITMTPGTLSVDVREEEKNLYIHWINVESPESAKAADKISSGFEKYLGRIFG